MDSIIEVNTFDSLIERYEEQSFMLSDIEAIPLNDGIRLDDDDVYVPMPFIYENCNEQPSNSDVADVDDTEEHPISNDVTTTEEPTGLTRVVEEDVQGCHTFLTPNGTKVWCPNQDRDTKPTVGATYSCWSDVIRMYKNYAECYSFSVRVGQTKKNKNDQVTHKYLRCNKARRPQSNWDSQLLLDRLRDRVKNLPDFYFDFSVVKGELRHVFWAAEILKKNYEFFGDVLAFDATYYTNK
ncbi:hypothetical protein E3N88_05105 [Mikania micrantha]|uniref:Protein FAR1-RELATED SEQUENCE n=1 Tax=Mikania micrantha TaxID=192012 RepID=A0A5N6PXT5_9ASTR|nr:hypothetical protein E3N88_05105 [Mikania micrantha]